MTKSKRYWAVFCPNGLKVDENGEAVIYATRELARNRAIDLNWFHRCYTRHKVVPMRVRR